MFLVVGLGNPGEEYAETPHNAGFMVVDRLAEMHGIRVTRKESKALAGLGEIAGGLPTGSGLRQSRRRVACRRPAAVLGGRHELSGRWRSGGAGRRSDRLGAYLGLRQDTAAPRQSHQER